MIASLPRWVGQTAALSLLLGMLAMTYWHMIAPIIDTYLDTDEEILQTQEQLKRYETLAHNRFVYQERLDELNNQQRNTGLYLSGATDALSAAELQNRVKEAVEENGAHLQSIQNLPVKAEADFARITVRVQFSANLASVHQILYELESVKPYVFVDNLDMRNRRARRRNDSEEFDPLLTIRFDLSGYLIQRPRHEEA